jgi:hypothetical protein
MTTDALGRSDSAGLTAVLVIGDATPVASIPWLVAADASGYTEVLAHVGQTSDRATLVERAVVFGGSDRGLWLRSVRVSSPSDEQRVDLSHALEPAGASYESAFAIAVDDARNVVFLSNGPQMAAPRIARVDPATGAIATTSFELGAAAPLVGMAYVGAPGTQLLDVVLSPDGALLYATTRDGVLHTLDAATLDEIGMPRTVGIVVANQETYIPSLRSPVASTAHGTYVASLATDGRVEIVDAITHRVRTMLTSASTTMQPPRPMHLRFLSDGLLVLSDSGIERFRCAN